MSIMDRKAFEFWGKRKAPPEVCYYVHNEHTWGSGRWGADRDDEPKPYWEPVTWKDVFRERKENQEVHIWRKRFSEKTETKPCFIWVFHVDWFLFGGYWLYIKTLKKDYGITFREGYNKKLILKVMELFPCGVFPDIENFDQWAENFTKTYPHKGFKRKKKQGLKRCFCKVSFGGDLKDVFIK